jgi:hypothetical protein
MLALGVLLGSLLAALPANIRKPYSLLLVTQTANYIIIIRGKTSFSPYLLEGRDLSTGDIVDIETTIVDELALGASVAGLGHTLERPVLGLVEHDGGPVVGLVLLERARSARRGFEVVRGRIHGDVERVPTNDLVQVRRVSLARIDEGVDAVDDELRAREAQHVLGYGALRQQRGGNDGCQLHRGESFGLKQPSTVVKSWPDVVILRKYLDNEPGSDLEGKES